MRQPLANVDVVAVKGTVTPETPFCSRTVLGRVRGTDTVFELGTFDADEVEGVEFDRRALQEYEAGGSLTYVDPLPARNRIVGWLVGRQDVDEVRAALVRGAAWHSIKRVGAGAVFVVTRADSDPVRLTLREKHEQAAARAIEIGDGTGALPHAVRAWLLAQPVDPAVAALHIRAMELAGSPERARLMRGVELRSHDARFGLELDRQLARLRLGGLRLRSVSNQQALDHAA